MAYLPSRWIFLLGAAALGFYGFTNNADKPDFFLPTEDNLQDRIVLETPEPIIVDGDTIKIGEQAIRIIGIDAPDEDFPAGKASAKNYLAQLLDGRTVKCRPRFAAEQLAIKEISNQPATSFDRANMSCSIDDRYDVGRSMIEGGYAVDYGRYSGLAYRSFQQAAKSNNSGLWRTYADEMQKLSISRQ